jgi:hypothetical protein
MGEVWKARDTRVDRVVAIKHLNAEHTDRFRREGLRHRGAESSAHLPTLRRWARFQLAMASPSVPAEAHFASAGLCLQQLGRFEESAAEMRRAVEKDPLSVIWRGILMAHLVLAGKYEEAVDEGLKAGPRESHRSRRFSGERVS